MKSLAFNTCTFLFQEWLTENFQSRQRDELILMETDNVLTPQSILKVDNNMLVTDRNKNTFIIKLSG